MDPEYYLVIFHLRRNTKMKKKLLYLTQSFLLVKKDRMQCIMLELILKDFNAQVLLFKNAIFW